MNSFPAPRRVFLWNKKCSGFSMAIAVYLKVRLSKIIAIVIYEEGNVWSTPCKLDKSRFIYRHSVGVNRRTFFRSLGEIVKLIHKKEQVKVVLRTWLSNFLELSILRMKDIFKYANTNQILWRVSVSYRTYWGECPIILYISAEIFL